MRDCIVILFLVSLIPSASPVGLYQQCGGEGYKGSTVCDGSLKCYRRSRWFSSCQTSCPGGDWECGKTDGLSGSNGLAKAWDQCGGEGWNGPRACQQYSCQWRSKWYAQCRPDCPAGWQCQTSGGSSSNPANSSVPTSTRPTTSVPATTTGIDIIDELVSESGSVDELIPESGSTDELSSELTDSFEEFIDELPEWYSDDIDDAAFGRYIVEQMLGSAAHDSTLPPLESIDDVELYDIVVDHIIEMAEAQSPGVMSRFGAVFQRGTVEEGINAWTEMEDLVEAIVASPEFKTTLLLDPLLAHEFESMGTLDSLLSNRHSMYRSAPVCDQPALDLGKVGNTYGDGRTTTAKDLPLLVIQLSRGLQTVTAKVILNAAFNLKDLIAVERGTLVPKDLESRLGAFYATKGYKRCTIGRAVHRAIGGLYLAFGKAGEEKIGRVFRDPRAKELLKESILSPANVCLAQVEHRYWNNVLEEDGRSFGGFMGANIAPGIRSKIQRFFGDFGCKTEKPRSLQ